MTPRELLKNTASRFRDAGILDPETDSALLLSHLLNGTPPLALRLDDVTPLNDALVGRFEAMAARRISREPLQYILQETWFCGLPFRTDDRALIPRPETEMLCAWAEERFSPAGSVSLLDLCCGSGCIGLTMKSRFPGWHVTLSDVSEKALSLAEENAARLNLTVSVHRGDLFSGVSGEQFDLILSNPPYIPSAQCGQLMEEVRREPLSALDGGADGMDFYRRIIAEAPAYLASAGLLMMELGFGEAPEVRRLLKAGGYRDIQIRKDFREIERMICAMRPEEVSCSPNSNP